MKNLFAFDLVVLGYLAVVSAIAVLGRAEHVWIYLAYHAAGALLVGLIVYAHGRFGGRFWQFLRYWYVLLIVMAAFREMHYLVPEVHPFDDYRFDRALAALDRRWFGDVDAFFLNALPGPFADFLHLCYWTYFFAQIAAGAILYRTDLARAREYVTVLLSALFISYLGYVVVPAIGPHHFFPTRPAVLDGWLLGGPMHAAITAAEWRMPDAFPSGHTLIFLVVLVMMWIHCRRAFWVMLVPGLGCIWATVALRYHYIVDVLASLVLLPVVVVLARLLHARWERSRGPS